MKQLRIVIVEDEAAIARNLAFVLNEIDAGVSVAATLQAVGDSVEWFNNNKGGYDLIFMDIQLSDGQSFDIFKQAPVNRPVIFLTAYDDYAIQAFKNNGIDYILKPFDEDEIRSALTKYAGLTGGNQNLNLQSQAEKLLEQINTFTKSYKKSFLVHYRDKLVPVEATTIAWFYTAHEIVYAGTADGRRLPLDFTMEQLEQLLDPDIFFRANRQFIINHRALIEADFYFNGRLSLRVQPPSPEKILISKARVPDFKKWMER